MTEKDDEDTNLCPVCCGPMDETDIRLFPCPCGYQLCMWCLNQITSMDNRCPNCRQTYNPDKYRIVDISESDQEEGDSTDKEGEPEKKQRSKGSSRHQTVETEETRYLQSLRIVQRNLVYLIGMPANEANEELLKSDTMFGRYGTLLKVVKSASSASTSRMSSVGL